MLIGLNSWTTIDVLRPRPHLLLDSTLALQRLAVNVSFLVNATAAGHKLHGMLSHLERSERCLFVWLVCNRLVMRQRRIVGGARRAAGVVGARASRNVDAVLGEQQCHVIVGAARSAARRQLRAENDQVRFCVLTAALSSLSRRINSVFLLLLL
jgi:hypothetical protein